MSEKRKLSHAIEVRLPEVESSTAVRFCPKCGQKIPNHRRICKKCEKESRRKAASRGGHFTASFARKISIGKLPHREFLIAGLILGGLVLIALFVLCVNPQPPAPKPAHTPVGTILPVILLNP